MGCVNAEFWKGKRVFLTGHTGFKGSWLSLWLQSMGAELHGLALEPPTTPSLFNEAHVASNMKSNIGDIREYSTVLSAVRNCNPEILIHMAAQSLVQQSYRAPLETFDTNIMGTVHVLEAARQTHGIKAIINVTTDKCYENRNWVWGYRENDPMGGHDPYSSSKGCSELITSAYRRSFFCQGEIAVASARAGNVIGGGDWAADRLIPDILRSFERSEPVVVRYPDATRPWQHVLEPLAGYLMLAERLYQFGQPYAEAWNFGPSEEDVRPVKWIVERMIRSWGRRASWQVDESPQNHEETLLKLDSSKARARLDWRQCWSLETALEKVIDWHLSWLDHWKIQDKCLEQIAEYHDSLLSRQQSGRCNNDVS